MKAPIYRQPCGCKSQGDRWLEMCAKHEAEETEIRKRWGEEYRQHLHVPTPITT